MSFYFFLAILCVCARMLSKTKIAPSKYRVGLRLRHILSRAKRWLRGSKMDCNICIFVNDYLLPCICINSPQTNTQAKKVLLFTEGAWIVIWLYLFNPQGPKNDNGTPTPTLQSHFIRKHLNTTIVSIYLKPPAKLFYQPWSKFKLTSNQSNTSTSNFKVPHFLQEIMVQ